MFAIRTTTGSGAAATHTACGRSALRDPAHDDALLLAVLVAAQQRLAEVVVHGRVGAAPCRAGERDRRGALAVTAHQQLGRGADEGRVAAADGVDVARREARAQRAEDARGIVVARGVHLHLPREHDLLERARADPLDGARDRALVVLGRHRRDDAIAAGRRGVEQRQRHAGAQLGEPRVDPLEQLIGRVVGRRARGDGQPHVLATARERDLRHVQRGGREALPLRAAPRRPARTRSRRRRRVRRPTGRPADRRTRPPRARAIRARPRRSGRVPTRAPAHAAESGERRAVAVGLLEAEPRLRALREAATSATGSTADARGSATVTAASASHDGARGAPQLRAARGSSRATGSSHWRSPGACACGHA